jgi:hypothetical protein
MIRHAWIILVKIKLRRPSPSHVTGDKKEATHVHYPQLTWPSGTCNHVTVKLLKEPCMGMVEASIKTKGRYRGWPTRVIDHRQFWLLSFDRSQALTWFLTPPSTSITCMLDPIHAINTYKIQQYNESKWEKIKIKIKNSDTWNPPRQATALVLSLFFMLSFKSKHKKVKI